MGFFFFMNYTFSNHLTKAITTDEIVLLPAAGCSSLNNTCYIGHAGVAVNRFPQISTPWGYCFVFRRGCKGGGVKYYEFPVDDRRYVIYKF